VATTDTWKLQYRSARFRNAAFFVDAADSTFGRRIVVHEFPTQDRPLTQDLGRAARRFSIDGYVLGPDYFSARNALVLACEEKGPGQLIHPYYGTLKVVCESINFRDTKGETRISRFTITFVEHTIVFAPKTTINTVGNLLSARERALSALNDAFVKVYIIAQKPFALIDNAQKTIGNAASYVNRARRLVNTYANFNRLIGNVIEDAQSLVVNSTDLIRNIIDVLTFGTLETSDPPVVDFTAKDLFDELRTIFGYQPEEVLSITDPSIEIARAHQEAAIIASTGIVLTIPFRSYDEAIEVQEVLIREISRVSLFLNMDDPLFIALQDLQTAVVNYLSEIAADLSRIVDVTLPESIPAIVLSYSLYGTVDREQDIIDRNNVYNPGFVPGGIPIEVLSNA
jgi:prophage DNA circulation protein